jgi:hypothetical protein
VIRHPWAEERGSWVIIAATSLVAVTLSVTALAVDASTLIAARAQLDGSLLAALRGAARAAVTPSALAPGQPLVLDPTVARSAFDTLADRDLSGPPGTAPPSVTRWAVTGDRVAATLSWTIALPASLPGIAAATLSASATVQITWAGPDS